jgi:hypothetical protein
MALLRFHLGGRVCEFRRLDADCASSASGTGGRSCRNRSKFRLSSKRELLLRMSGTGAAVSLQETKMAFRSLRRTAAERRCALGALIAAAYRMTHNLDHAHNLALKAVRPLYGTATLININDLRGHARLKFGMG